MSYIKLLKALPDGRQVEYHRIGEVVFTEPGIMLVKMQSFTNEAAVLDHSIPDATISISIPYSGTYEEAITDVLAKIHALPDWSAGTLVDTSIPAPPPSNTAILSTITNSTGIIPVTTL